MATKGLSLPAVSVIVLGSVLAYSGLRGKQFSAVFRNLVAGKDPSLVPVTGAIATVNTGGSSGANAQPAAYSNSSIVNAGRQYLGVPYHWGTANPRDGWDCSGYVNYVLGHDLGMTLPLGVKNFTGSWHGPVTANYLLWTGATSIPRSQAQPGDLACWPTHIGIVSGSNLMLNAYSTGRPTAETPIDGWGPPGEPLTIRRINGTTGIVFT